MELNGGCLHEFIAAAIQDSGIGVLTQLNDSCVSVSDNQAPQPANTVWSRPYRVCRLHRDRFSKRIINMQTIPSENSTRGCYGGAFMEYDSRTMAGGVVGNFPPINRLACARDWTPHSKPLVTSGAHNGCLKRF